ncbi:MAG: AraC family transcriptional regulator [Pseudomonadota bacterium]
MNQLSIRQYGASHGSHSHGHFQVLFGLAGRLELEVEGRACRITAGDGRVIAPGDRHDFEAPQSSLCLVIDSDAAALAPHAGRAVRLGPRQRQLATYLADAWTRGVPAAGEHGALLLLSELDGLVHPAPAGRRLDWERLARWVDARLQSPLTVAMLASQVHLSPSQFAARCRREQGVPPMAWIRERRIDRARQALAQGLPVSQTAILSGYRSPSALTAAMRRQGDPR